MTRKNNWKDGFFRRLARGLSPLVGLGGIPVFAGLVLAAVLVVSTSAWFSCGFRGCPDPGSLSAYQPGGAPVLLDRDGNEWAQLHPLAMRLVPLDDLPPHVPAAFVAVEDRRFYRHGGVDWVRVVGAAVRNVSAGGIRQGASTITMQLARTLFPDRIRGSDRTMRRKLLEIRVARRIERRFSKPEILELYLNHVYMGAGAYGIEAGAHHYFERPAVELTAAEAALLAAVVRAPVHYDPRRHPEVALARRNLVLALMEDAPDVGDLELAELAEAREGPLGVTADPPARAQANRAPYFAEVVRALLEEELGEELYRTALRIETTLDLALQEAAEEELVRQIERVEQGTLGGFAGPAFDPSNPGAPGGAEHLEGAVVFLDPNTGDILALVGGRDFQASRFNRAVLAHRQMGSAFKPFVYAAALGRGYVASQPLADRPFTVHEPGSPPWTPRNYDGEFRGEVSMRDALVESLNIPTVRLALAVGAEEVTRSARTAGISGEVPATPATALGTASSSPLELAVAYGALASGGLRSTPRTVTRVEAPTGRILYQSTPHLEGVLDPRVAHIVTDMLVDAVNRGTGSGVRAVGYAGPVAGKTGTTQNAQDAWFVGYTPGVVGVVWIGFDRPRTILPGASGGGLAAPVWGRVMHRMASTEPPPTSWARPSGVVSRQVDPSTGRVLGDGCPRPSGGVVEELFLEEFIPVEECPPSQGILGRISGFFRSLGGGSSDREPDEPAESSSDVVPGTGDEVLGVERVPLISPR